MSRIRRSLFVFQIALAGCVLPPDRHARLAEAGVTADAAPPTDADAPPPGEDARRPPEGDSAFADARSGDAGATGDAAPGRDGGAKPDAGPPARFQVEGRLVLGAGASTGDTHRIVGRVATGETRAFGMNYGIEGGLRISCNQEATCIDTAE
jgi:hypothetical protein